ncbi:MAG: triose-phosphate isomerase [Phyllobacterium sp.]
MTPSVRPIVAGNWKMNGTSQALGELKAMSEGMHPGITNKCDALVCVPATLVHRAVEVVKGTALMIGGQDTHAKVSGAHTGDISAEMLKDAGASHVIVGHSERRTDHGESSALVMAKAVAAWEAGLVAIICVGETESERRANKTLDVILEQLQGSIPDGITAENTIIAYEPVWAIGTGLTPTAQDVEEVHAFMRADITKRFGLANVRLLYGGSVKPSNAAELLAIANVDGALVGGASLKAADFLSICEACELH